jgi:hypothetical protein
VEVTNMLALLPVLCAPDVAWQVACDCLGRRGAGEVGRLKDYTRLQPRVGKGIV